ncbi:MAG: hypothetical protein J5833_05760, partial [Victivallales bacterium]|nr:hypothetical protein [Victivallales bacterium]
AFEIKNRELLSMGENALASRDFAGAVNYFYELRDKLSSAPESGDYLLSSALLAEACLGFPSATDMELGLPNKGKINTFSLAQSILAQKFPENADSSLKVYWQFLLARLQQTQGKIDDCLKTLSALWGDAKGRADRLKDLHNWVLLAYMQTLAAKAENLPEDQADPLWSNIVALSKERLTELKGIATNAEDEARKAVTAQAGQTLRRSPRQDALEVEFIRLKACALLETEHFEEALEELKRDSLAVYAAERNWLLAACLANLSRLAEAEAQYEKCERDFAPGKDAGALLAAEIRKAQWAMFNMYYKAEKFMDAEAFLEKLQPGLKENRKFDWLVLRMNVLKGRLNLLMARPADVPKAELSAEIDAIYNCALRYSFLFPDTCQANWKAVIGGFTPEQRKEYCQVHVVVLHVLGQAEAKIGNVNVAMELFDKICHSEEVDDSMRYESCMALGDIAASDIRRSIDAYRLCETLRGVSREQKANALFKAAGQALKEARRETAAKEVREAMGNESVEMLKRLCFEYTDTGMGLEAALQLADFYYEKGILKDALAFYERYFMSDKCNVARRDYARLRWGRSWRLLAERADGADKAKPSEENLQKALNMLTLLRDGEATDSDVRSQATLEAYRVALAMARTTSARRCLTS